ncbi:unnamed protein product [Closterium sp. NIES-54]
MATPSILTFDAEGRPIKFEVWLDDLHLFLQITAKDDVSLYDHTSGAALAPPATADSTARSQWQTRDAHARLAVRSHLPLDEREHFGQHKRAKELYDAVVARYSSPATAAIGRLSLPYLFPDLSAFATVADLITHLRTIDLRYRAAPWTRLLHARPWRGGSGGRDSHGECLNDPGPVAAQGVVAVAVVGVVGAVGTVEAVVAVVERCSVGVSRGGSGGGGTCPYVIRTGDRSGQTCGRFHMEQRCFFRLDDAWREQFPDATELPRWADLLRKNIDIFALDFDAILGAMYALTISVEGDCYLSVPPDPGIGTSETAPPGASASAPLGPGEAAALGASASAALGPGEAAALGASASAPPGASTSALAGTASTEALHTFTLDSGASRCFFRDRTALEQLARSVAVSLADPSGGPVIATSSSVLPCPAVPSGTLSGLYLPSFSMNLVAGSALQGGGVHQFTPAYERVTHCTCARTGRHLATFTRQQGSDLYTVTTESPQVAASASASGQLSAPCSCCSLSHQTVLWHHRLGHPSVQRLRGMHSRYLVSGLPRVLPPLPPSPAPPCLPCVEGWQRAAPHSSFPPTEAPLQTLHLDVAASASASGQLSAPCSCCSLSHQTVLWHHRLGHPSVQRLHGMHSWYLVSGLPRVLPPLPPSPAPPCLPCVEGWQRAAPHSSFPPTEAPLQTLHLDVWGPARVRVQGHERYFLLVVDDYMRYTTVFPLPVLLCVATYRPLSVRNLASTRALRPCTML